MIDLDSEPLMTLRDAGRRLLPGGADGRPVHPSTVARWVFAGVRDADGGRVRLDHVKVGGRLYTSAAAIRRFAAATTRGASPARVASRPNAPTPGGVERELDRLGF